MPELIANSQESLSKALGAIREAWGASKWLKITYKTGKRRTLDQNDISHVWYGQVADELREDTALGVKAFCKLTLGVPILRAEDAEFRKQYDSLIRDRFTYEEKLEVMAWLPVTSLLTRQQLSQYLEAMQQHYERRGVRLEFPKE